MATFTKYYCFVQNVGLGAHNLNTAVIKIALTNTAPAQTDTVWSTGVYPAPTNTFGYTAGGNTPTNEGWANATGTSMLKLASTTYTASGGAIGPVQYCIMYDSSSSNNLIGSYNYGSSITLNNGETFTISFDQINGVLTLA